MSKIYVFRKKLASNPIIRASFGKLYMGAKSVLVKYAAIQYIKGLDAIVQEKSNLIFYLDIPTHPNMGDLAQYCCIKNWLKDEYSDYGLIEISAEIIVQAEKEFLLFLKANDNGKNLIFFQSGYCTQDLGGTHDYVHKLVVGAVQKVPVVMLPQTILYKSKDREKQTADIYRNNKRLLLLCRDGVSFKMAQESFPYNRLELYPDIVTSLIGTKKVPSGQERMGILICCRNDIERFYSCDEITVLKKKLEQIDAVTISDTTVQKDFRTLRSNLDGYVNRMIEDFGHYRVVITDRYHGTIFSLIAGTPVIVIKSNDHKVITGVHWFKGVYDENVCYIEDCRKVPDKVREIYHQFEYKRLAPYFTERYYSKLKSLVEKWRQEL